MNFLIPAILVALLGVSSLTGASEPCDLERIRTLDGREYRGILILEADQYGLSFRHDRGIAKLPLSSLADDLRRRFTVIDELAGDPGTEEETTSAHDVESFPGEVCLPSPVVLLARSRTRIASPALYLGGGYTAADRLHWPAWWPRYDPVHELTNPYFRELAVRDFLYSSGLLPTAPGIIVRTVYR